MNFRRREVRAIESIPRLSLVAFIDIVLFLLLYLMLAGTLAPPESRLAVGLERPSPATGKAPPLSPIKLRVDRSGERLSYHIGQREVEGREAVVVALTQVPKDGGVIVTGGEGTIVADIAASMQAAKDAGFTRVSYAPGK
ncbi:MAG: biopolymer transporter ExbD [Phycisphaerales bacterium]|nr:biopolymer transporter ExbD [Phycisphaerales bacterium]